MYLTGILQAFGIVILSAIFNVYIRTISLYYDIDPIMFTLCTFMSTSLILCFFGGPGRYRETKIFSPATLLYGLALSITFLVDIYLVKYVSGTEASIFSRWAIPVCLIISTLKSRKTPTKSETISFITIMISIIWLLSIQPSIHIIPLILLGITLSLSISAIFLIAESSSDNSLAQQIGSTRLKLRTIGISTLSASIILFSILSITIILKHFGIITIQNQNLPDISIFKDYKSMITGTIWGLIFSPFIFYLKWSASYKINSNTVLIILSFIPIVTLGMEYFITPLGVNNINLTDTHIINIICLILLITFGSGISYYIQGHQNFINAKGLTLFDKIKNAIKLESKNLQIKISTNNMADYEVIKNTVDFYEGDTNKASKILNIPEETIKTLLYAKDKYSLSKKASEKVHEIFRNKIFYLDQLTSIENKKGLIKTFSELQSESKDFNLYYLDLNKFKSINDTFGHNIGDLALITTARRLKEYAKQNEGFAYRLGGDEFAFLTTSSKSEETIISEIKEYLAKPFDFDLNGENNILELSTSVGRANIIKDSETKIKDLIHSADSKMYNDKTSK